MTRFQAVQYPSGNGWGVRDTEGSALRYGGTPTSFLTWQGMDESTAVRVAERYENGFRPS